MTARAFTIALIAAHILFVDFAVGQTTSRPIGVSESDLKAVFVIRLLDFVKRQDPPEHTKICLLGRSDTASAIKRLGATKDPDTFSVDELQPSDLGNVCNLLFISGGVRGGVVTKNQYFGVLTVSDSEGFAAEGGMIQLLRKNNRIGLKINAATVEAAGIQLSSRLLGLAEVIRADEAVQNGY